MAGRSILALGLIGLALMLAGCGTRSAPPPGASGAVPGQGYYKVGAPYEVDGAWYYPHVDPSYDRTGIASWYGEAFHGRYTANGEIFNLNDLTAAHPTLPLPSIVEVTNLENGRTIDLRVNDRGPYVGGRIIDVSRRASQLLGFEIPGTAKVRVRYLAAESQVAQDMARHGVIGDVQIAAATPLPAPPPVSGAIAAPLPVSAHPLPMPAQALPPPNAAPPMKREAVALSLAAPPASPPSTQPARVPAVDATRFAPRIDSPEVPPLDVTPVATEPARIVRVSAANAIYVQAGAFADPGNARHLKAKLDRLGPVTVTDATVNGVTLYRVRIGPVDSVDAADRLLWQLVDSGISQARIIVD